jgi:hypothetical protein
MDTNSSSETFWSAVAERSGDAAFEETRAFPKRRGASLPAAVQKRYPSVTDYAQVLFIGVHWC